MTDAIATAAIVATGSALTIVAQLYREARNRKWDAEDRDRREAVALLAAKQHATHLLDKIAENTEISVRAFDVANNVNEKIASIGLELKDGRALSPGEKRTNS